MLQRLELLKLPGPELAPADSILAESDCRFFVFIVLRRRLEGSGLGISCFSFFFFDNFLIDASFVGVSSPSTSFVGEFSRTEDDSFLYSSDIALGLPKVLNAP